MCIYNMIVLIQPSGCHTL